MRHSLFPLPLVAIRLSCLYRMWCNKVPQKPKELCPVEVTNTRRFLPSSAKSVKKCMRQSFPINYSIQYGRGMVAVIGRTSEQESYRCRWLSGFFSGLLTRSQRRMVTTTTVSNLEAIFILNICICANEFDEINHSSGRRYEEVTKTKYDLISKIKSYNFFCTSSDLRLHHHSCFGNFCYSILHRGFKWLLVWD